MTGEGVQSQQSELMWFTGIILEQLCEESRFITDFSEMRKQVERSPSWCLSGLGFGPLLLTRECGLLVAQQPQQGPPGPSGGPHWGHWPRPCLTQQYCRGSACPARPRCVGRPHGRVWPRAPSPRGESS